MNQLNKFKKFALFYQYKEPYRIYFVSCPNIKRKVLTLSFLYRFKVIYKIVWTSFYGLINMIKYLGIIIYTLGCWVAS